MSVLFKNTIWNKNNFSFGLVKSDGKEIKVQPENKFCRFFCFKY